MLGYAANQSRQAQINAGREFGYPDDPGAISPYIASYREVLRPLKAR
jgi:hypothetical protein